MLHIIGYGAGLLCPLACAAMMWPMFRGRRLRDRPAALPAAPVDQLESAPAREDTLAGAAR